MILFHKKILTRYMSMAINLTSSRQEESWGWWRKRRFSCPRSLCVMLRPPLPLRAAPLQWSPTTNSTHTWNVPSLHCPSPPVLCSSLWTPLTGGDPLVRAWGSTVGSGHMGDIQWLLWNHHLTFWLHLNFRHILSNVGICFMYISRLSKYTLKGRLTSCTLCKSLKYVTVLRTQ